MAAEIGNTSTKLSSGFQTPPRADGGSQGLDFKMSPSLPITTNQSNSVNQGSSANETLLSINSHRVSPSTGNNMMISENSITLQPQPVIVRKDLSSFLADSNTITIPGRRELSVTPLVQVK